MRLAFAEAKDEIIKAKEAQIQVLQSQLEGLRELSPMKIKEYVDSSHFFGVVPFGNAFDQIQTKRRRFPEGFVTLQSDLKVLPVLKLRRAKRAVNESESRQEGGTAIPNVTEKAGA
jgi:hypothetical protein